MASGIVKCPQCNTVMNPEPVPDRRTQVKVMTGHGSSAEYAGNFADKRLEKEVAAGVVHRCPACGYTTRVKAGG